MQRLPFANKINEDQMNQPIMYRRCFISINSIKVFKILKQTLINFLQAVCLVGWCCDWFILVCKVQFLGKEAWQCQTVENIVLLQIAIQSSPALLDTFSTWCAKMFSKTGYNIYTSQSSLAVIPFPSKLYCFNCIIRMVLKIQLNSRYVNINKHHHSIQSAISTFYFY